MLNYDFVDVKIEKEDAKNQGFSFITSISCYASSIVLYHYNHRIILKKKESCRIKGQEAEECSS
jgi:hypothetical protein